jgi:hypothetical protein
VPVGSECLLPGLLITEGPPLDGTTALVARGAMQIFCWGVVQGQTITLDVHPNTTVATVKAMIYRQTGKCPSAYLPACRRRLPPLTNARLVAARAGGVRRRSSVVQFRGLTRPRLRQRRHRRHSDEL